MKILMLGMLALGEVQAAGPEIRVDSIDALKAAARSAAPGTRLLLAPGRYTAPQGRKILYLSGLKGEPGRPLVIAAADPADPPVLDGGDEALHLAKCSYVRIENLICEGAYVNNVQFTFCDHIVMKGVVSRNMRGGSNHDGVKMPGTSDFLLLGCTIENWGPEGSAIDMVGCARGLIMDCLFRYPNVKGSTANGTQPKGGSYHIGIYKCRFEDASHRALQIGGGGSNRHLGLPYQERVGAKQSGYDQVAMGNVIRSGGASVAWVSVMNTRLEYNTLVHPRKYVMRILKEGAYDEMRGNVFRRNLVVYGRGVRVVQAVADRKLRSIAFIENYWYNSSTPEASIPDLPARGAAGGEDPGLDRACRPAAGSAAASYGAHASGLEAAWAPHTQKFAWAWRQAVKLGK